MKKKLKILTVIIMIGQALLAQQNLPVINANSNLVDIKDGGIFYKAHWTISPKINPDIYTTSNKNSKVTFYTDKDSISFIVKPGEKHDFIIILNKKDTAHTRITYAPGYLETLKKASKYNLDDKREMPKFTYQSSDDPNLIALRKAFNLDSIAGTGNEFSQILNLMHWMHNYIPHDGEHGNPDIKNAISMIAVCKKESRGLNCRGLAMALNECYLALGFKSRYITCLPKDSLGIDQDCHVINMVFSNTLKKWLWIDPTFDDYIMNDKGEMMSIREVREALINGTTLILNPDANWNHKTSQTKEDYLYNYMAKNLYRLECPVSSEYNTETFTPGKTIAYIQLIPLDYFKQGPAKQETKNKVNGTTFINYQTNNPTLFWQAP